MTRMVEVRVVVKGPGFERDFLVQINPNAPFQELKDDLVQTLTEGMHVRADQFVLNVEGTYIEPVIVLTMR